MGKKNTLNKIPPKSRNNPTNNLFMCFFLAFFFAPQIMALQIPKVLDALESLTRNDKKRGQVFKDGKAQAQVQKSPCKLRGPNR